MTGSPRGHTSDTSGGAAAWMYEGLWSVLSNWFRVPDRPVDPPASPRGETRSFQPDLGFLRYLKLWFWIALVIIDLLLIVVWIILFAIEWWLGLVLGPVMLALIIVPDIIAYLAIHLRYDTTWYAMTDRSLRIRRGIWVIHETTITFENIQNVKVTQGPVQRLFGIASVMVETAGSGGGSSQHGQSGGGGANIGLIEGIADAHDIRDRILAQWRQSRSAGLGDEHPGSDDASGRSAARRQRSAFTPAHMDTLRDIRDAVRAMGT